MKIQSIFTLLEDAESGHHSYLLSGRESYLSTYRDARPQIDKITKDLHASLGTDSLQLARLGKIDHLVVLKLERLEKALALAKTAGNKPAMKYALENEGQEYMDQIRSLVAEMSRAQEGVVIERRRENATILLENKILSLSVSFSALCMVLASILLLRRSQKRRSLAESEIVQSNHALAQQRDMLSKIVDVFREFAIAAWTRISSFKKSWTERANLPEPTEPSLR